MKIISPYAPGGYSDILARLLGKGLSERLKQSFVVENKAGAGGVIGTTYVYQQPADGYTVETGGLVFLGDVFHRNLPYSIQKDFQPVGGMTSGEFVMVASTGSPARLKDFITMAKGSAGKLNYAAGTNSAELLMEMLKAQAGFSMVGVRYKGNAPGLQALLADEVQAGFDQLGGVKAAVDSGKIRLLATTGKSRLAAYPDVPTFAEAGLPAMTVLSTSMAWVRTGSPPEAVEKLAAAIRDVVAGPDFADYTRQVNVRTYSGSPKDLIEQVAAESAFWAGAAKAANYQPE